MILSLDKLIHNFKYIVFIITLCLIASPMAHINRVVYLRHAYACYYCVYRQVNDLYRDKMREKAKHII